MASLIHIPIGPASVHLVLNGIVGLLLGWSAFPVILVALILQAVFFQYGGITTLGVNTVIMAFPAVLCYLLFGRMIHKGVSAALYASFVCGFLSVLLGAIMVGISLVFTEEHFIKAASLVVIAHLPVMIVDGIITSLFVSFLRRVQPTMLPGYSPHREGSP